MNSRWVTFALALSLQPTAGCSRPRAAAPATIPQPPRPRGLSLPDVSGFAAGPPEPGERFVRRAYVRGRARVQVTLARMPLPDGDYQRWQAASAGFPQADLGLPAADANGFYQCDDGAKPSCDLLIQLRTGFHLELRGGGTTARADVDALASGLPLQAWASELPIGGD
ncbi:MAG: hypothetical protein ABUR63_06965 [Verrucomicrobiota bacterium]